jgi:hypothetical protein
MVSFDEQRRRVPSGRRLNQMRFGTDHFFFSR